MPRIEAEPLPAPRLEPGEAAPVLLAPGTEPRPGGVGVAVGGLAVLLLGIGALGAGNFVADEFARAQWLGWLSLGIVGSGFGLLGFGVWRELSTLFRLRSIDRLRAELAAGDVGASGPELRSWLAGLPDGEAALETIGRINDPDAVVALLRAGPVADLRARADALGRTAAVQVFAAAAAVPSPAFDGLLVGWRGIRLVRQVAALHGLRPGLVGTFALLRRTMLAAAGVVATDLAADTLARALLSSPLLAHFAGDVAGAGVAARRMIVLARATAAACDPLPPPR